MEKVKYKIAIQTCMEVFDFLMKNNLFVFDAEYDFLKSRITITEAGFVKETQSQRGNWKNSKSELVPTLYVLNILIQNVEKALSMYDVSAASIDGKYASIPTNTPTQKYYKSYKEILDKLKNLRRLKSEFNDTGKSPKNMHLDFGLEQNPQVLRQIECYAKLEEQLKQNTYGLLIVDEYNVPATPFDREYKIDTDGNFIPPEDYKFASEEMYVYWDDFKNSVLDSYEYQRETGIDMHMANKNFISDLGLDGKTI